MGISITHIWHLTVMSTLVAVASLNKQKTSQNWFSVDGK